MHSSTHLNLSCEDRIVRGRAHDEDDDRYAVAEDTQQGSSEAESYTRRARYASPEVPYIGQAVAEDHTSQQSYAPSTSQE